MITLKVIKTDQIEDVVAHFDPLSQEDFEKLVKSIEEIGLIYPLIVRKDQNKYVLIDGRNRLRALNKLGIDEVPVIVIEEATPEITNVIDTIMQIDAEIARRHLDPAIRQAKYQERQQYVNHLRKTLRSKIFRATNGDSKNVTEVLDNVTLKQLINIHKAYSQLNKIPDLLDKIFPFSESKLLSSEDHQVDEKILQIKMEYEKILKAKENELKAQAETIAKLTDEKNRLLEKYNEAKSQYDSIVRNLQEIKQEMENKIREQVQQELELLRELRETDNAQVEEIKAKIEMSIRKEYEEKIRKLREQEIEWNKNLNAIRLELAKKTKELEEKDAKIRQLQDNISLISSEKARLQSALKDFVAKFKAINTHTVVEKLIELIKMPATNVIYLINTLNPTIIPGEEDKLLRMWKDTKAVIEQLDEVIMQWISQQKTAEEQKKL